MHPTAACSPDDVPCVWTSRPILWVVRVDTHSQWQALEMSVTGVTSPVGLRARIGIVLQLELVSVSGEHEEGHARLPIARTLRATTKTW